MQPNGSLKSAFRILIIAISSIIFVSSLFAGQLLKSWYSILSDNASQRKAERFQQEIDSLKKELAKAEKPNIEKISKIIRSYSGFGSIIAAAINELPSPDNIFEKLSSHRNSRVSQFAQSQIALREMLKNKPTISDIYPAYPDPPIIQMIKAYEAKIIQDEDGSAEFKKVILESPDADYRLAGRWFRSQDPAQFVEPVLKHKDPLIRSHAQRVKSLIRLWRRLDDYRRKNEYGDGFLYGLAEKLRADLVKSSPELYYPRGESPGYPIFRLLQALSYWEFHPYYTRIIENLTVVPAGHAFELETTTYDALDNSEIFDVEWGPNVFRAIVDPLTMYQTNLSSFPVTLFLSKTAVSAQPVSCWFGYKLSHIPYLLGRKLPEPGFKNRFRSTSTPYRSKIKDIMVLAVPSNSKQVSLLLPKEYKKYTINGWTLYVVDKTGAETRTKVYIDFTLSDKDLPGLSMETVLKTVAKPETLSNDFMTKDPKSFASDERAILQSFQEFAKFYSEMNINRLLEMTVGTPENLNKPSLAQNFINIRRQSLSVEPENVEFRSSANPKSELSALVRVKEKLEVLLVKGVYRVVFQTPTYTLEKIDGKWRISARFILYKTEAGKPIVGFHQNLAQAEYLLQAGPMESAVWELLKGYYAQALRERPDDSLVLGYLADCYLGLEKYDEAINIYQKALRKLGTPSTNNLSLGSKLLEADLRDSLAYCHLAMHHPDQAEKELKLALEINPHNASAYYKLALCADLEQGFRLQRQYLRKAQCLNPDKAYKLPGPKSIIQKASRGNDRGLYLFAKGKYIQALKRFEKAQVLDPDSLTFRYNLANTLFQLEKYPEAIKHMKICVQKEPTFDDYYQLLGNMYAESGQNELAKTCLMESLRLNPFNSISVGLLEGIHKDQGNYEECAKLLEEAKKAAPNDLSLRNELGEIYSKLGRSEEAIKEWEFVLNFSDDSDVIQALEKEKSKR